MLPLGSVVAGIGSGVSGPDVRADGYRIPLPVLDLFATARGLNLLGAPYGPGQHMRAGAALVEAHHATQGMPNVLAPSDSATDCSSRTRWRPMRRPSTSSRHRSISLPRFILVGATTLPGWLSEPFRDRFELQLSLEYYSDE